MTGERPVELTELLEETTVGEDLLYIIDIYWDMVEKTDDNINITTIDEYNKFYETELTVEDLELILYMRNLVGNRNG